MVNSANKKEFGTLPVSKEKYILVKQKQLEITNKTGKIVSLTEITDKIITKGLPLVE